MKHLPKHLCQLTATLAIFLICTTVTRAGERKNIQLDDKSLSNLHLEYGKVVTRKVSVSTPVTGAIQLDTTRVHDVVPRISGIISKDHTSLGDVVKTGDPLVQLESQQYALALIKYFEAEHEMEHSMESYSREKSLVEKKVSSPELLLNAEHDYRIAQINHTSSLQLLKLLHLPESELHRLLNQIDHADLTKHLITAPANGVIINKEVRLGLDVKPDQLLLTIADLSQLWVDIKVPIKEAGSVKLGSLVKISTAIDQRSATAKVIYVAAVADAVTRTILVRAVLNNQKSTWRPGTAVSVQINDSAANQPGSSLAVPQNAVFDIEGEKAVFIKVAKGKFRLCPISAGANDGKFTQILSGLAAEQTVVTRNVVQLKAHFLTLGEQ